MLEDEKSSSTQNPTVFRIGDTVEARWRGTGGARPFPVAVRVWTSRVAGGQENGTQTQDVQGVLITPVTLFLLQTGGFVITAPGRPKAKLLWGSLGVNLCTLGSFDWFHRALDLFRMVDGAGRLVLPNCFLSLFIQATVQ